MKPRSLPLVPLACALILTASLAARPSLADFDDGTVSGPHKLIAYAACAGGIFFASTTGAVILAMAGCYGLFLDESNTPSAESA